MTLDEHVIQLDQKLLDPPAISLGWYLHMMLQVANNLLILIKHLDLVVDLLPQIVVIHLEVVYLIIRYLQALLSPSILLERPLYLFLFLLYIDLDHLNIICRLL